MDARLASARALTAADALDRSSGPVEKPDSYNYRTMRPEPGGLYSEEVFGPADLHVRKTAHNGIERRSARLDADHRRERWGHIELAAAIPHPLVADQLLTHVLVVPPDFRRFLRTSAQESRVSARKRREEILAMDERSLCDPKEKILAEEGLLDEAAIDALGPTWVEPSLNGHYRAVLNINNRYRRLRELGAPADIVQADLDQLITRVKHLFDDLLGHRSELGEDVLLAALSLVAR